MSTKVFNSRRNILLNTLLIGIQIISLAVSWYISLEYPSLRMIFLILLVDFPLLGYFIVLNNSFKFHLTKETLRISYFGGSREIQIQDVVGYYDYTEPIFEFHLEASFPGAKLTRNNIGSFYYYSPGIRKGLILEYKEGIEIERLFIVPKAKESFIDALRLNVMQFYDKKIDEFNGKFYIK